MWERAKRAIRLLAAIAFGLASVVVVFTGLSGMIAGSAGAPLERVEPRRIVFEFTPPAVWLDTKRDEKPVRSEIEPPPPNQTLGLGPCFDCDLAIRQVPVSQPIPMKRGLRQFPIGSAYGIDADPQPIVRIPPQYPPHARGDGFVLVQFDISPAGTVVNARVVDSAPRGMFETNALKAIARWRYRPAVSEGRAAERRGLRVRLRFELERA